jgi:hypothetical protein
MNPGWKKVNSASVQRKTILNVQRFVVHAGAFKGSQSNCRAACVCFYVSSRREWSAGVFAERGVC